MLNFILLKRCFLYRIFFIILLTTYLNSSTLKIYLQSNGVDYRTHITKILSEFQDKNPNIKVEISCHNNEEYKQNLREFLKDETIDIFNWQGGQRLFDLVKINGVEPLASTWEKYQFNDKFGSFKNLVFYNNIPYAIPISYYQWGFYYNKKLFSRYNLSQPKTWKEFVALCEILKQKNIVPIILGTKNSSWTAASWFDYINLRINGLEFHNKLLQGEIPYTHKKVKKVFQTWQTLLKKEYITKHSKKLTWNQPFPYILREKAGMMLIGNFITNHIPNIKKDQIGFFSFPVIDPQIPQYEEAPLDIFFINKLSKNKPEAHQFIKFLAQKDIQKKLNEKLLLIPANQNVATIENQFLQDGYKLIKSAKGLSQYFDLDTPHNFSVKALNVFTNFINNPNIEDAVSRLEYLRKQEY